MSLDLILAFAAQHADSPEQIYKVDNTWSQGRTIYGGLSAGILYNAMRQYVAQERPIRAINTHFVGPLLADTDFRVQVEILREGKNVSQIQARAIQNDKICVLSTACFAQGRNSKITVNNTDQHLLQPPNKKSFIPQIPKITPKFLQHIELAIQEGGVPFLGNKSSHYYGWMRFKNSVEHFNTEHLISIIDAWPPTLLQMLKWPAPASTVNWNLEFIYPHRQILPTDWLAYKANTRQAAEGYGHTEANIWDAQGELIAISRQTVAVFD